MTKEYNKVLKYNHGERSMKHPFIIYAELDSLFKKCAFVIIILKDHQKLKYMNIPFWLFNVYTLFI